MERHKVPLLKPEIRKLLSQDSHENESLENKLEEHGLSLDSDLEALANIAVAGDTSAVRLRAIETSLKLKGVLKEQPVQAPNITIIIQDEQAPKGVNPILLPRQLHVTKPS